MSNEADGGQAFPIPLAADAVSGMLHAGEPGMTLRDWFAGQVLAGLCREYAHGINKNERTMNVEKMAYGLADAMLKERALSLAQQPKEQI